MLFLSLFLAILLFSSCSAEAYDDNLQLIYSESPGPELNSDQIILWKIREFLPEVTQTWQIYAVQEAFALWSEHSYLSFGYEHPRLGTETKILFEFVNFTEHSGCSRCEHGNMVKVTVDEGFFLVKLNNGIEWAFPGEKEPKGVDLITVAAHAIGHVLGLTSHSVETEDLMHFDYSGPKQSMGENDVLRLEKLHCFQGGSLKEKKRQRRKRGVVRDRGRIWANATVPYRLSWQYNDYQKLSIRNAMQEIQDNSCIRFVEQTHETDYLNIVLEKGCWSYVGKKFSDGPQKLSLESKCLVHGVIMHELLHALGFFHEQSRRDRNEYVNIRMDNVRPCQFYNFERFPPDVIDDLGAPYDYSSIMHFSPHSFSKYGYLKATIEQKQNTSRTVIGQRRRLSYWDKWKLNKLYCPPKLSNQLNET